MKTVPNSLAKIRIESVVYRHDNTVPNIAIPSRNATVEWITEDLVENVVEPDHRQEEFQYLLDAGYSGLLAYNSESWIAYGWISGPESTKTPYHIPDWIGDLDLYWLFLDRTKEKYQKNGWHKYLLAERLRAIYDHEPNAAIFIDTTDDNVSRFSMVAVGFNPAGKIVAYRFGYPNYYMKTIGRWNWKKNHPPLPE